jgi:hypothetical protein
VLSITFALFEVAYAWAFSTSPNFIKANLKLRLVILRRALSRVRSIVGSFLFDSIHLSTNSSRV